MRRYNGWRGLALEFRQHSPRLCSAPATPADDTVNPVGMRRATRKARASAVVPARQHSAGIPVTVERPGDEVATYLKQSGEDVMKGLDSIIRWFVLALGIGLRWLREELAAAQVSIRLTDGCLAE